MTCIVAYKKDGTIYMGADSAESDIQNIFPRKDPKLFIRDDMIFGFTSSFRMGSLLRYSLEIPKRNPSVSVDQYMNTDFINAVIKCFDANGYSENTNSVKAGGNFIVGYQKRIFKIQADFQVGENVMPFNACGSGEEMAIGAMDALLQYDKDINPVNLLTISLTSASKYVTSVGKPFKILKL